jgi:hypothetical protein
MSGGFRRTRRTVRSCTVGATRSGVFARNGPNGLPEWESWLARSAPPRQSGSRRHRRRRLPGRRRNRAAASHRERRPSEGQVTARTYGDAPADDERDGRGGHRVFALRRKPRLGGDRSWWRTLRSLRRGPLRSASRSAGSAGWAEERAGLSGETDPQVLSGPGARDVQQAALAASFQRHLGSIAGNGRQRRR